MKYFLTINTWIFLASVIFIFNSCKCSCDCEQAAGCITMVARDNNSGDTVIIKKFCSTININADKAVVDSVNNFYSKYSNGTTFVQSSDSVYSRYRISNLKCDEIDFYANQNFNCECYK